MTKIVLMLDGSCPSCLKQTTDKEPFRMRPIEDSADPRESTSYDSLVPVWKPASLIVFVYLAGMGLAATTGTVEVTAIVFLIFGRMTAGLARIVLFLQISDEAPMEATMCLIMPFGWVYFARNHWRRARWPVTCGLSGAAYVLASWTILKTGSDMLM
jgi:hypothetical protein